MQNTKLKKSIRKNRYLLIAIGTFLIVISIGCLFIKYHNLYNNKVIEDKGLSIFFNEDIPNNIDKTESTEEKNLITNTGQKVDYIAVLEIPKINLKRGLVNKDSYYNQVKYNIEILKESNMPNGNKGNLILASHSGNSRVSYFKDLDKLSNGDISYVYYQNTKYIYQVIDIYEVDKVGTITLDNYNENTLTMITCKNATNKQIVVVSKLIETEEY